MDSPLRDGHSAGPLDAPVLIVEYGDFECPGCKAAARTVRLLLELHPAHVRVVFRHFPLMDIHHNALAAALAAEAAADQGKFWEMHDLLFQHQPRLAFSQLRSYAAILRLDLARFEAAMEDPLRLERVLLDSESGRAEGVRATPTFFVNGEVQDVSFGIASLVKRVQASLNAR